MKLTCKLRKSTLGKGLCVAPFINDYNVWDIPVKQWTPDVQEAIKRAYELGAVHARGAIDKASSEVLRDLCDTQQGWPKPTKETK